MIEAQETIVRKVGALLRQLQLISHFGAFFARSADVDEINRLILALLVSRNGGGFSRAFLFNYDADQNVFMCTRAVGISAAEESAHLCEPCPPSAKQNPSSNTLLPRAGESLSQAILVGPETDSKEQRSLDLLANIFALSGSDDAWLEQLEIDAAAGCALDEQSRGIMISLEDEQPDSPLRRAIERNAVELIERESLVLTCREQTSDLLDDAMLVLPIRTNKGVRSIVLVDRKFDRRSLSDVDKHYLQWLGKHASVIIENAELFGDLENAHKDLKDLDTLKSNFLSIISHELRTPLTAIIGFVELLLEGRVGHITEAQRSLLVRVSRNAEHLVNMVNDLLEIAEIEAEGLSEIKIVPVDPLVALMNTLPRIEHRRQDRNIIVEPVITGKIPRILSEERALERILYHLIDNAVKFSHKNSKVLIEFKKGEDRLRISIRDHGIGISQNQVKGIFDNFHQIDNRLSRSYGGMGLGLTVSRMLLSATGGSIEVESTVGVGSTFTISYPIYSAQ
jgi:signal transduction histidine kinase